MKKKAGIYFILVVAWCLLIFFLSHQPKEESAQYSAIAIWILKLLGIDLNAWTMGNATLIVRKAAHITEYFILTSLTLQFINTLKVKKIHLILFGGIFSILYAASDEFHQTFISGRVGCIEDVWIDSVGIIIALVLYLFVIVKK